jgi:hypothetical protein
MGVCLPAARLRGKGQAWEAGHVPQPRGKGGSLARSLALAVLWAEAGGGGRHLPPILFNCCWVCRGGQIGVLRARSDPRVRAARAKRWEAGHVPQPQGKGGSLARSRWLFCGPKPAAVVATSPPSCSTVVGSAGGARSGFCARVLTLAYVLRRPRDGPRVARWRGGGVLLLPCSHASPPALPPTPRSLWACRSAVADCCVCLMCRQHDGARYQPGAIVA